jgi:hypothetical protein
MEFIDDKRIRWIIWQKKIMKWWTY